MTRTQYWVLSMLLGANLGATLRLSFYQIEQINELKTDIAQLNNKVCSK